MTAQSASDATLTTLSSATATYSGTSRPPPLHNKSTKYFHCEMDALSASTGSTRQVVPVPATIFDTFALDAARPVTELKHVLEQRSCKAQAPYDPDTWEALLLRARLLPKYNKIPDGFRTGFDLQLPHIHMTQTPPNK